MFLTLHSIIEVKVGHSTMLQVNQIFLTQRGALNKLC